MKKIARVVMKSDNSLSRFSVKIKRKFRVKAFEKREYKVLEVSGGRLPLSKEYLNVDISNDPETDVLADLLEPLPFADNFADEIVSVATLEHFTVTHVKDILNEFYRVLKPGGVVKIGVPSLEKIFEQYQKKGCDNEVLRYLHGGLKDEYDIHFFVVDSKRFIYEIEEVGFVEVKEVEYDFPRHSGDYMMKLVAKKAL